MLFFVCFLLILTMYNVVLLGKSTVFSNYENILSFFGGKPEYSDIWEINLLCSQPHSDVSCFGRGEESGRTGCNVVRQV